MLYSSFPPALYFTHDSVYVSATILTLLLSSWWSEASYLTPDSSFVEWDNKEYLLYIVIWRSIHAWHVDGTKCEPKLGYNREVVITWMQFCILLLLSPRLSRVFLWTILKISFKNIFKGFFGGLVFKILSFHCRGLGSIHCWGTKILQAAQHSQK